ncbi:MAG: DNA-directed RNA polymerase subunit alpha [Candidatus Latescibacteria bacterium]|nr:DNA-directed RNA polymerase subunit alpha [Candidatus Latescibacterota bacterium]
MKWKSLHMPKSIDVDEETLTESYGKFEIQPLERGFGITIGNALRRILLSSIQGAAIDSISFDNIHHEFSTLPGVVEDIPEIILNLKEVDIKLHSDDPVHCSVDIHGPHELVAGDLAVDSRFEVVNQDHHIAQIDKDGVFRADFVVNDGRGYVPADEKTRGDSSLDTILIDSIYSPIRKVNYHVGNARIGHKTDYDKLTIEIWTNKTIIPADALAFAAKILTDHLKLFINFEEDFEEVSDDSINEEKIRIAQLLDMPVEEMELSVRSSNCLKAAGIKYIRDLVTRSEQDMLKYRNFGRKSLSELGEVLTSMNLSFGLDVSSYDDELAKFQKMRKAGQQ